MPTLPACTAVRNVSRGALRRSPGVTFISAATKPDTASATSMTRAHHHRDDAAATRPRTRRGTVSRHPACCPPRCSDMMRLSPIQPMMTARRARRDDPYDRPRLAHYLVFIGEAGRSAGQDVGHGCPPPQLSASMTGRALDRAAQRSVDPLDHPAREGPRPTRGVERGQDPVPDAARLVDGNDGVEGRRLTSGVRQHRQQIGVIGVELGLLL